MPETIKELAGAVLANFTLGRDAISLSFEKRLGDVLMIYDVVTYGRLEIPGNVSEEDEDATASALPELLRQIGRHLARITHSGLRRYRLEFVSGAMFEMADPNEFSDYAVQIQVKIASSGKLESLILLDD